MLDIEEINNTIEDLENSSTTFDICMKLAALYTIQDRYQKTLEISQPEDAVEQELNDIPPQYKHYCEVKRRYQMGQTTEKEVLQSLQLVCKEIEEFIQTLYNNTNFPEERQQIFQTLQYLSAHYSLQGQN